MAVLKVGNLVVAFLLELAMLAAFATWGFSLDQSTAVRFVAAVGAPLLAALFWAGWMAPKAPRRLRMPGIALVKVALYALAGLALLDAGHPVLALLIVTTAWLSIGLAVLLRQDEVVTGGGATSAAGPPR